MSGKTTEKDRRQAAPCDRAEDTAGHPLDAWLRRELRGLGPASPAEPLPPGMAALAERLEARLREAEDGPDAARTDADRATTS